MQPTVSGTICASPGRAPMVRGPFTKMDKPKRKGWGSGKVMK